MYEFYMKNNDFATWRRIFVRQFYVFATLVSGKESKTTISLNFRSTVLRFCNIKTILVRQFYVFATWCAGKQSKTSIYKMKTKEALTFLTVRKLKTREALTFSLVFTAATTKARAEPRRTSFSEKQPTHRNLSVSRSHTASHRTHERNETISRFGVD